MCVCVCVNVTNFFFKHKMFWNDSLIITFQHLSKEQHLQFIRIVGGMSNVQFLISSHHENMIRYGHKIWQISYESLVSIYIVLYRLKKNYFNYLRSSPLTLFSLYCRLTNKPTYNNYFHIRGRHGANNKNLNLKNLA